MEFKRLTITLNSLKSTDLTKDDRLALFPKLGVLYPAGCFKLAACDSIDQVRAVCEPYMVSGVCWLFL